MPAFIPKYTSETIEAQQLSETVDWGQRVLGVPALQEITKGEGIIVAVVDSGAHPNHPDMLNTFTMMSNHTKEDSPIDTGSGHGLAVSSIIAANDNNSGMIGVAPDAQIISCKVLGSNGSGGLRDVANGIKFAREHGAQVINLSLGSSTKSVLIEREVIKCINQGVIVVAASGNQGAAGVLHPGNMDEIISVGAVNKRKKVSDFSSIGPEVDIVGPGESILVANLQNGYSLNSGTSFASPFVAGIIALMISMRKGYTQEEVKKQLEAFAIDINEPGFDINSGHGLINPKRLVVDNIIKDIIESPIPPTQKEMSCIMRMLRKLWGKKG